MDGASVLNTFVTLFDKAVRSFSGAWVWLNTTMTYKVLGVTVVSFTPIEVILSTGVFVLAGYAFIKWCLPL